MYGDCGNKQLCDLKDFVHLVCALLHRQQAKKKRNLTKFSANLEKICDTPQKLFRDGQLQKTIPHIFYQ